MSGSGGETAAKAAGWLSEGDHLSGRGEGSLILQGELYLFFQCKSEGEC